MSNETVALDEALEYLNRGNSDIISLIEAQIMELQNESVLFEMKKETEEKLCIVLAKFITWVYKMITKLKTLVKSVVIKVRSKITSMTVDKLMKIELPDNATSIEVEDAYPGDYRNIVMACSDFIEDDLNSALQSLIDDSEICTTEKDIEFLENKEVLKSIEKKYKNIKNKTEKYTVDVEVLKVFVEGVKDELDSINDTSDDAIAFYKKISKTIEKDRRRILSETEDNDERTDIEVTALQFKTGATAYINLTMNAILLATKAIRDEVRDIGKIYTEFFKVSTKSSNQKK